MSGTRTVAIVGSGIVGLCAAWYARRDGHRVILVEQGGPDRDCCSLGNSGLIVPSHIVPLASPGAFRAALRSVLDPRSPLRLHPRLEPDYLRWCWLFWRAATQQHVERSAPALRDISLLSKRCYEEFARDWGNSFGLTQRGLLVLCATQRGLEEEARTADFARQLDVTADVLDPRAAARIEPNVAMTIAGAIHYPLDSHLTPQRFVQEMTGRVTRAGVDLRWSTTATGWRSRNGRLEALLTDRGDIEADDFVIAAGSWSAAIACDAGLRLPLQAGRGYNLTLSRPPRMPALSAILNEARIAVTPMGGSLRFGGTLQLAGLDRAIDAVRVRAMIDAIPRYFPEFSAKDFESIAPWSGLRPCSPDGLPYIGRARSRDNLIVATGHAMMGMSLGPATGVLVSDILTGRPPSTAIGRFDPNRYC